MEDSKDDIKSTISDVSDNHPVMKEELARKDSEISSLKKENEVKESHILELRKQKES